MKADTLVYEKKGDEARLASIDEGRAVEFDFYNENRAGEGNVYLGKIVHKLDLANGNVGFLVDIGDSEEAFLNASEHDLKEARFGWEWMYLPK